MLGSQRTAKKDFENIGRTVRLSRRAQFSAAHFYRQRAFSDLENARVFGSCFSPTGHGHNYVLEAIYLGRIQADTGLVVNLIDVDRLLKKCLENLDHKHLNFDVAQFRDGTVVPTTENLARYCFNGLRALQRDLALKGAELESVRIFESEDLWAEWPAPPLSAELHGILTLEVAVPAMHSLSSSKLSVTANEQLYGMCYRLHGHDYRVRASFRGDFERATGLFADRERLACALDETLVKTYRGRNLSKIYCNTSCESLVCSWFDELEQALQNNGVATKRARLTRLAIQETRKNWFSYSA